MKHPYIKQPLPLPLDIHLYAFPALLCPSFPPLSVFFSSFLMRAYTHAYITILYIHICSLSMILLNQFKRLLKLAITFALCLTLLEAILTNGWFIYYQGVCQGINGWFFQEYHLSRLVWLSRTVTLATSMYHNRLYEKYSQPSKINCADHKIRSKIYICSRHQPEVH